MTQYQFDLLSGAKSHFLAFVQVKKVESPFFYSEVDGSEGNLENFENTS